MASPSILHIDTGKTFRGGQRQLALLTRYLDRPGIKQIVACPAKSELKSRISDLSIVGLADNSLIRKIRPRILKKAIEKHRVNIVHAHDSESHTLGILVKRSFPDVRLIVSRRVVFRPSGAVSRIYKYGSHVDHYIAVSRAAADGLHAIGIEENAVTVIPDGLEISDIRSTPEDLTVSEEIGRGVKRLIVTAGALTAEKDFETAVRAMRLVTEKVPGVGLIILGEGPERARLERIITDLQLNNIFLAGHREPMAPIFKACDLFLVTSTSEGLNTSAIEAAACGLPLVASGVGGLPEIAEENNNGVLCRPRQPEEFAGAILSLLENEQRRRQMGENSVQKAKQFDIALTALKTLELYNRLLAE
jgi:glycosyltransferase involved in cell wall biosynthesis